MTPWKFIKHYALEIYTVIAMILLTVPAFMGELSAIQKFMVIYSVLFVLHEWEEGMYPGGFVNMIASLVLIEVSDEIKRASRIPAGILLLLITVVPFVFDSTILFAVAVATFGIIEGVVHVVGIRLFQCKTPYTPGMVTAILEATESFALIAYLACNHLGAWYDYVFGPLLMIVCFGMLQKTMTLLVGIRYSDMPKYVKAQWKRGNRA